MRSLTKFSTISTLAVLALFGATGIANAAEPAAPTFGAISSTAEEAYGNVIKWYGGTVTLTDTVSASAGLTDVYLYETGTEVEEGEESGFIKAASVAGTTATVTFEVDVAGRPEGTDCFEFGARTATDQFARSGEEGSYCINFSHTAPGRVSALENGHQTDEAAPYWNREDTFTFQAPTNDYAPITTAYYTVNGGPVQQTAQIWSTSEEGPEDLEVETEETLPDGSDEVCLWLGDEAGNSDQDNQDCFTTHVDHAAPEIVSMSFEPSNDTLVAQVSDNVSGVTSATVEFFSPQGVAYPVAATLVNGVVNATLSTPEPGEWVAVLTAEDAAENQAEEWLFFNVAAPPRSTGAGTGATVTPGTGNTATSNTGNAGTVGTVGTGSTATAGTGNGSKPKQGANSGKPQVKLPKHVKLGSVVKAETAKAKASAKTTYSYQWQVKKGSRWVKIKGATKASLKITKAENGRQIRVGTRTKTAHGTSAWAYSKAFKA